MNDLLKGHFLFLGTGASMGIPVIGCRCAVCQSESPCNHRLRPSALITIKNKKLLIDCGPDFRLQALKYHIHELDGLLLTHPHHDHIAGVDELRALHIKGKKALPCLLSKSSAQQLQQRYDYIFNKPLEGQLTSKIHLQLLEGERGTCEFQGFKIRYLSYEQAGMKVTGFRLGNLAYISDIKHFPETIYEDLQGVEILVVSALRNTSSPFHLSVDEAALFAEKVGASQAWLTHIAHELDHEATNARLPSRVRMAYDGLELHFFGE